MTIHTDATHDDPNWRKESRIGATIIWFLVAICVFVAAFYGVSLLLGAGAGNPA